MVQSVCPRDVSEPAQQRGTDASKVFCVCNDHRDLGISGLFTCKVIGYAEQLAGTECAN
jgi:hypothetical protein